MTNVSVAATGKVTLRKDIVQRVGINLSGLVRLQPAKFWHMLFISGLLSLSPALARPACMQPEINDFLERARAAIGFNGTHYPAPTATYLPFERDQHPYHMVGCILARASRRRNICS